MKRNQICFYTKEIMFSSKEEERWALLLFMQEYVQRFEKEVVRFFKLTSSFPLNASIILIFYLAVV